MILMLNFRTIILLSTIQHVFASTNIHRNAATDSFYFETTHSEKSYADAESSCESRNGWISEPNTNVLVELFKTMLKGVFLTKARHYYQGLQKVNDVWIWNKAGNYSGYPKRGIDNTGNSHTASCSFHGPGMNWLPVECNERKFFVCQFNGYCEVHNRTCKNEGSCRSTSSEPYFMCNCTEGYFGDTCDTYCEFDPYVCKNEGSCRRKTSSPYYECDCKAGSYGINCTDLQCDAYPDTCKNEGTCLTRAVSSSFYECKCKDGYYGDNCTDGYCEAHRSTCKNGGSCQSTSSHPYYMCKCEAGYFGDNCQYDSYCDFNSSVCEHSGECQKNDTAPYYNCVCKDGSYGYNCSLGYCAVNPKTCKHNGTCTSDFTTSPYFECSCVGEYSGDTCTDGYCAENVKNNPCQNNGSCFSKATTEPYYECACPATYCGDRCERRSTVLESGVRVSYYFESTCEELERDHANEICIDRGGWLAEPKTQEINDAMRAILTHETYYHGGLKNMNQKWKWKDGEEVDFTNWKTGDGGTKPCMYFGSGMAWFSGSCNIRRRFVCQFQSIEIKSIENAFAVKGEPLVISLNITTYDGAVKVNVSKDGRLIMITNTMTENSTINYTSKDTDEDTAGIYRFTVYPVNGAYSYATATKVTVHVRAFIDDVTPTSIYAPISNSPTSSNCTFGGTPKLTSYGWYRNGTEVPPSGSVYQTKHESSVLLHIENAKVSDRGEYVCIVTNRVADEADSSVAESRKVNLEVYAPPHGMEIIRKPCDAREVIFVKWIADAETENVNHRFTLILKNANSTDGPTNTTSKAELVEFEGLKPETWHEVFVEVCPKYGCISKLNATISFVTGRSLPDAVLEPKLEQETNSCFAKWSSANVSSYSINNVTGYNVVWEAVIKDAVNEAIENITGSVSVAQDVLSYRIPTFPNKKYYVRVSSRNCAGNGTLVLTEGECSSEKDAPAFVPAPIFSRAQDGVQGSTREIVISMAPDESNGSISCLFVVLYKEEHAYKFFPKTLQNLETLSSNAFEATPTGGYIAFALKRKGLGQNVSKTLGNGEETSCDVLDVNGGSNGRKKRFSRSAVENTVTGKSAPLEFTGTKYRMLTITATPLEDGSVKLQNSGEVSFIQGYASSTNIITYAIIGVVTAVLAVIIILVVYHRKKCLRKVRGQKGSLMFNDAFSDTDSTANEEETNDTVIPFHDMKRQFLLMSANESKQFKEQYGKLKRISKDTALLTTIANTPEAMTKNRYVNILPYDVSRVHLNGDGIDSYINACYVQGGHKTRFIAAQGPLPNTTADFWRMITEQKCQVIVMLTKCEEGGKGKCEKYWPSWNSRVTYDNVIVQNVDEKRMGGITIRTLKLETSDQRETEITQYQFLRWPDHGVPLTTSTFLRLHKKVMIKYQSLKTSGPILVHCSAGVGRTGTFIGFDILNDKVSVSTNIYQCVLKMRRQRVDMVQTCAQYEMLHKLLLEIYTFQDTEFSDTKLLERINKGATVEKEFASLTEAESFVPQSSDQPKGNTKVVIVRQEDDTEWVRINATVVEAYNDNIRLIASEGPTTSTTEYFLRAIWDNEVDVIVMLHKPDADEDSESQYATYWPTKQKQPLSYNNISVELMKENEVRGTVERTLRLTSSGRDQRNIQQLQFMEWTSELPSQDGEGILDLINRLKTVALDKPKTVMVHCTDGLGKTGVFITAMNLIERFEAENRIDVFRTVKDLRDIRPGMVKTKAQYKFCFQLLHLYISQKNVYENSEVIKEDAVADPIYQNL